MPKCELCEEFEPPKSSDSAVGFCRKFGEARRLSDSCNLGEAEEDVQR